MSTSRVAAACVVAAAVGATAWSRRPRRANDEVTRTAEDARLELRNTQIRAVPGKGLGVFARRPLPRWTLIGPYPGKVRRNSENDRLVEQGVADNDYALEFWRSRPGGVVREDYVINPRAADGTIPARFGGVTPYVNEPSPGTPANLVWVWNFVKQRVEMWTSRDVAADQELFICYGAGYGREYKTSCTADEMPRMAMGPGDAHPRPWYDVVTGDRDPRA